MSRKLLVWGYVTIGNLISDYQFIRYYGFRTTRSLSLSLSQFSRKITSTDKAGAMKASQQITTQHGQLIFSEIFTKDNTEPN